MKKKVIRLTESDLKRVISESVKKLINEIGDTDAGQRYLANAHVRKKQKLLG